MGRVGDACIIDVDNLKINGILVRRSSFVICERGCLDYFTVTGAEVGVQPN